jgi:N-acyl amino acid synthase of PEP-CTERM/exosortase system
MGFMNHLAVTRLAYRMLAGYMFHRYFQAVSATTDVQRNEVFRIRYDVYCAELGFEDPKRFTDRREIDEYDEYSLYCLLYHKGTHGYAGCVRLVMVDPQRVNDPLPFEQHCRDTMYKDVVADLVKDRTKVAEISRLAVRSTFRRRRGENRVPDTIVEEHKPGFGEVRTPWIALGLYLSAAATGLIKGLDGVFALMEPRLARCLGTHGIKFVQVGEPVEYRGQRAPFFISREALYAGMPAPVQGLLAVIEDDLRKTGASDVTCCKPPAVA